MLHISTPRALLLAGLGIVAAATPARAAAPGPDAQCTFADVYKFVAFGGYAVASGTPVKLTLTCSIQNDHERHVSIVETPNSAVAVTASVADAFFADPWLGCTKAVAEYADGTTATTSHCRYVTET